ncbi:MAG: hypothetical protein Phog2KO_50110 [Phototrophicaceae bacterium]
MKLAQNWWIASLRGFITLLFGVAILEAPDLNIANLVVIFGLFALTSGVILVINAYYNRDSRGHWEVNAVLGILNGVIGIIALIFSDFAADAFIYLIAIQAFTYGFLEVANVVWARKELVNPLLLSLSGLISLVFGVVVLRSFIITTDTITPLLSFYLISVGTVVLAVAIYSRTPNNEIILVEGTTLQVIPTVTIDELTEVVADAPMVVMENYHF